MFDLFVHAPEVEQKLGMGRGEDWMVLANFAMIEAIKRNGDIAIKELGDSLALTTRWAEEDAEDR